MLRTKTVLQVILAYNFVICANALEIKTREIELQTSKGPLKIEIHYAKKDDYLAKRALVIASKELLDVVNYFEYTPNDTVHLNIDYSTKQTNGSARAFPTNLIELYNFPASNSEHLIALEDWWKGLIVHEFTHVVHLEQTREFNQTLKNVFGNLANVFVGVVPHWFAEGIATWSESHFSIGGRLKNAVLDRELEQYILRQNSSLSIDEIDDPGHYPFGQLAYWAGAHFMEYLENKRAGTIRCLVTENSTHLPFQLNLTFKMCTGKEVKANFKLFIADFLAKHKADDASKGREEIKKLFGESYVQKSWELMDSHFYQVEKNDLHEALVFYDLDNSIAMNAIYPFPIASISNAIKDGFENEKGLLVSFAEDPNFKEKNRYWKWVNGESLAIEEDLNFNFDPSYVTALSKNDFLTFSYENNAWVFRKVQKESNEKNDFKELIKLNIKIENQLLAVIKLDQYLLLKIFNTKDDSAKLISYSIKEDRFDLVYQSKNGFDLFYKGPNFVKIKEGSVVKKFDFENDSVLLSNDLKELENGDAYVLQNDHLTVALNSKLEFKKGLQDKKLENRENVNKTKIDLGENEIANENEDKINDPQILDYPKLAHFKPHYWFFNSDSSKNVSSFGAQTQASDPYGIHNFSGSAIYYMNTHYDLSSLGGKFAYDYSKDDWNASLNFSERYTTSDLALNSLDMTQEYKLGVGHYFYKFRSTYFPSIVAGQTSDDDFISKRQLRFLGLEHLYTYKAESFDDLYQSLTVDTRMAIDAPKGDKTYANFQTMANSLWRLKDDFTFNWRAAYGNLFKNDFGRGVLFGGGGGSANSSRFFDFYGVPLNDAYGNKMFTIREQLNYKFARPHTGFGMWPFFLRDCEVFIGHDFIYTDRIIIDLKNSHYKSLGALFLGAKLATTLFYILPVDFNLVMAHSKKPDNSVNGQLFLMINAGAF